MDASIARERAFSSCNCYYPCRFELRPAHENCRGFDVGQVERNRFEDVDLDWLHWGLLYEWPGTIFERNGTMQANVNESTDE